MACPRVCRCGEGNCCNIGTLIDTWCPPWVSRAYHWYRHNRLLVLTFLGVILGIIVGLDRYFLVRSAFEKGLRMMKWCLALSAARLEPAWARFIGFPGSIFLRVLQLMILPIIIASIISGAATLHARATGLMAARALGFFFVSTLVCAALGFAMVMVIRPGTPSMRQVVRGTPLHFHRPGAGNCPDATAVDAVLDLFRNAFPENIILATMKQVQTVYVPEKVKYNKTKDNETETDNNQNKTDIPRRCQRDLQIRDQINALGLIVFCLAFGMVLGSLADRGKTMVKFFHVLDLVVTRLVRLFMWFTPLGVASLICERLILTEDWGLLFSSLGWFIMTVLLSLMIHQLILLPLVYFAVMRRNPFVFSWRVSQALLTAFALASSAATLPVTFRCMEDRNHVNLQVLRFVLPVGATINMDGTAIFTVIAPVFLAQIHQVTITAARGITLIFMASAVSVAAAAIPSASLFLMLMLTTVLQVPTSEVSILFTVDWLLDRLRTTSNVLSDCYAAALVEKWSEGDLHKLRSDDVPFPTVQEAQKAREYAGLSGDQPCTSTSL